MNKKLVLIMLVLILVGCGERIERESKFICSYGYESKWFSRVWRDEDILVYKKKDVRGVYKLEYGESCEIKYREVPR